jgi:hypothetical protein
MIGMLELNDVYCAAMPFFCFFSQTFRVGEMRMFTPRVVWVALLLSPAESLVHVVAGHEDK